MNNNNFLRINIVAGPFLPIGGGPSGAVEKRWMSVAKHLSEQGHQVTVIGRKWESQQKIEIINKNLKVIRKSGYTRSSSLKIDLLKDALYSFRVFANIPQADVTVTNVFWLPVIGQLRRKKLGKIVVNVARFPKGQMGLYKNVDRISAVSSAISNEIISQTPQVENITKVVPNPVDLESFYPDKAKLHKMNSYRVLYTGRVHEEKGVHLLVEACKELSLSYPTVHLSILGPVDIQHGGSGDNYLSKLKKIADGLDVSFEKSISEPKKLAERMRETDFYCYPSLADKGEAFGVAPLEAMALGFPPIISNLACFKEFAEKDKNCFIFDHKSENPTESLISVMRTAFEKREMLIEMSNNAITTSKLFSVENIANKYLSDWQDLINNSST